MHDLERHINRLTSWIKELTKGSVSWSNIVIAEDTDIQYDNPWIIPRSALSTPEEYLTRFSQHLDAGHSWINMNAAGILDDVLLIIIQLPRYKNTVPRDKVSVNLSGPVTNVAREPKWNAAKHIQIVDNAA